MEPELFFTEYKADFERLQRDGTLDFLMMLQKGRTMGMGQGQAAQSAKKRKS